MERTKLLELQAYSYFKNGHNEKALRCLNEVVNYGVKDDVVYLLRGMVNSRLLQHKSAIRDYNRAIEINPNVFDAYFNRGLENKTLKRYKAAIEDFSKSIELSPTSAQAYFSRGAAKYDSQQIEAAIKDYDRAIKIKPNYPIALNNRGLAKSRLGNDDAAIKDFDRAIKLDRSYADFYLNRGVSKVNLGLYEAAIEDYNQAINLDPEYALAYNNRGTTSETLRRYTAAIEDFDLAIEIDLKYADAYYGKFSVYWFGYKKIKLAQIHLNRFLSLSSEIDIVENWKDIQVFWVKSGVSQPFLIKKITNKALSTQYLTTWQSFLQRTNNQCRLLKQYLWHIRHTVPATSIAATRLEALINYYMGDPMEAYRIYDEILDGELECISLMGQYYFIRSAMDFLEPHESLLQFALQDAEDYCSNNDPEAYKREWYYAGMLYILKEDWQSAYEIFGQLDTFLPAAVMRVVAAEALEKPAPEIAQLKAKARSLVSTLPEDIAYQNGFPAVQLDLEREDFLTPFLHYANYREILEHIHIIQDEGVEFEYMECWEVWQLHPEDASKIGKVQREKELESIRQELEAYFTTNLEAHYANYPEEEFQKLEALLQRKQKDLRDTFEQLKQKAEDSHEALEHELGLQIDSWDLKYPGTYALLLRYFYVAGQLPPETAFRLYFYFDFVATRQKERHPALKAGLKDGLKKSFEILASPLPFGTIGIKITAGILNELMQQYLRQKPKFEEEDPRSDYEVFKEDFLRYLSEKMETMGRERFLEQYPLAGW